MRVLRTVLALAAAGVLLAGCDACGRFPWQSKNAAIGVCKPAAPQ